MWRLAIIILLTAAANGQTVSSQEQSQTSAIVQSATTATPKIRIVQRYDKLRRGRDEIVAIGWPCSRCVLSLEAQRGFSFRYGHGRTFTDQPAEPALTEGGLVFLTQIKAARDLPAGEYTITGKISGATRLDRRLPDEIEVAIPVTVVDHDAAVTQNPWPFHSTHHPVKKALFWVAVAPMLPFILIYLEIACGGGRCD